MNRRIRLKSFNFLVFIALLGCVLPLFSGEFELAITTYLLVNLIAVVSFRLIATLGLWSFAHIALMGMAGYISGLLDVRLGYSFWLTLPVAVSAMALISFLLGLPILRVKFVQFFLASWATGEAFRWMWIIFRQPFGGYDGLAGISRPDSILGISFSSSTAYYYLLLFFTLLSLGIMYWLEKSRIGDTVKAIASNEELCTSMGINCYRYKLLFFVIGSSFASLAGVFLAHYTGTVNPNQFAIRYCIQIAIFFVVGGASNFAGPIIGAILLTVVSELLRDFLEYLPLIYGVILIVVILILPGGLISLPRRISPLVKRIQRRKNNEVTR